jgi:hypothetical protein
MAQTIVTIKLFGGAEHVFTTRTYMCTGDRIAFERHFKVSTGELKKAGAEGIREEWIAFFCWRAARRALGDDLIPADFAPSAVPSSRPAFLELLEEVDLEEVTEETDAAEAAPDPTPIPPAPTG